MTKESRGVGRCCSRTDFSNLFTRPRDSRKACCTRGHVFEIREIDSSVCARVCRVCSREEDECILITRSLPMTPGNRVYVASVSTRHCVYVHPRATAIHALLQTHKHTHTRGKVIRTYRLCKWTRQFYIRVYTRRGRRKVAMVVASSKWIDFSLNQFICACNHRILSRSIWRRRRRRRWWLASLINRRLKQRPPLAGHFRTRGDPVYPRFVIFHVNTLCYFRRFTMLSRHLPGTGR